MSAPARVTMFRVIVALAVLGAAGVGSWQFFRPPILIPEPDGARQRPDAGPATAAAVKPPRRSQAYVGSTACRECHSDTCETYATHPMASSLAAMDAAPEIEDYTESPGFNAPPTPRSPLRLRYYVSTGADGFFHHEVLIGADGAVIYDQAVPIHYEIGSGERGRSYITNRDGVMLMSPMTWYTQKQRWDFSPGYHINNLRFERPIIDGCVACHAGRVAPIAGQPNHFASTPFLEEGIGCERCHGPGEAHIAFHRGELVGMEEDPIVNPADLEPQLRDSVCYQCHFQGVERIPRYGRTDYDFRPGDDVSDIWAILVLGTGVAGDQTTEAVSQVEQMLSSACYRKSDGRLGCISCHDPHSIPSADQRVDFYRARCLNCHAAGDPPCSLPIEERRAVSPADSCIECHMPRIAANDVPHTSQTDHRVIRKAATGNVVSREDVAVLSVFGAETGAVPPGEVDRARGIYMVIRAERSDNPALALEAIGLLEAWLESAPDDVSALEALGSARFITREIDMAFATWQRALELTPDNEGILRRMMYACHDHEQIELGVKYGRRLVQLNPWNYQYLGRLAHMLGQIGEIDEAIELAERAVELNPATPKLHSWLAEAYRLKGDSARAAEHQSFYDALTARE